MNPGSDDDVSRTLQEKSTLFLITSDAMNVAANEFLQLSRNTHRHWEKLINVERQQRRRLEETVEALGKHNVQWAYQYVDHKIAYRKFDQ